MWKKRMHRHRETPTPLLNWSGFFLGAATLAAVFGIRGDGAGDIARYVFFVLLVLGIAPLVRSAANETA